MVNRLIWMIIGITAIACSRNASYQNIDTKDNTVVFLDIKEHSRKELPNLIKAVSGHGPKVIGLSVIFDSLKSADEDSLLAESIRAASNIVLAATINEDSTIRRSHSVFIKAARSEGLLSYLIEEDGSTSHYIPLFENAFEQAVSFPDQIVYNYDSKKVSETFNLLKVNETKTINCTLDSASFLFLQANRLVPAHIKDRIVIFASFDSSRVGRHTVKFPDGSLVNMKSAVVTANVILKKLSGK